LEGEEWGEVLAWDIVDFVDFEFEDISFWTPLFFSYGDIEQCREYLGLLECLRRLRK
jgi:hypothetical protein